MKDRVALVTGGGRGIGRATALLLGAGGARVAVTARSGAQLEAVAEDIRAAGGLALPIEADLSDRAAPGEILRQIASHWGSVEILVNNAGVGSSQQPVPLVEFDDDFWDLTMAVNVTAPYLLTRQVLPAMIEAQWGRIINISSINARVAALHAAAYVTSKHAVAGLTKATAKEVADQGVTANAVCPGVTATLMNDRRLEYDAARLETSIEQLEAQASPLGRRLTPREVAAAVLFLASDEASAINGQLLNVDGGTVMF